MRGSGFFIAVELVDDRDSRSPATVAANRVVNELRNRGILTHTIGPEENILKLRPPMVFSTDEADLFLTRFDEVLAIV